MAGSGGQPGGDAGQPDRRPGNREVRARGYAFDPETDDAVFNIAGRYGYGGEGTRFLATSDGTGEGSRAAFGSIEHSVLASGLYAVSGGQPNTNEGEMEAEGLAHLRGSAQRFTLYEASRRTCESAPGIGYWASITIGSVDSATGDLLTLVTLHVKVAIQGEDQCDMPGDDDAAGWQLISFGRMAKQ